MQFTEIAVEAQAVVVDIEDCPEICRGPGRVVTGRFVTRQGNDLVRVRFANGTELTGTRQHPVWSPDSGEWVGLGEFKAGQHVRGRQQWLAVESVTTLPYRQAVYNIEVDGEHVYEVTDAGILVHNNDFNCNQRLDELELKSREGSLTDKELAEYNRLREAAPNSDSLPTVTFSSSTNPELAANIRNAQAAGHLRAVGDIHRLIF
ncbi:MAG: hypothetical protein AB7O62_04650 [Pirellulales bacterium]